jgi:hypothetical protein
MSFAAACGALGINAKITVIVVGKRHHVRFFPADENKDRKSQNCLAGTVVNREITHPTVPSVLDRPTTPFSSTRTTSPPIKCRNFVSLCVM